MLDALVIACTWNTNVTAVSAWMLRSSYALGTRTLLWFGHGCSGDCMFLEHERYYSLGMDARIIVCFWNTSVIKGMDALVSKCSWNMNIIMVWAGCSGHRMLLEQERYSALGMHVWSSYALGTRALFWLGRGCSGQQTLLEHEWKGTEVVVSQN